MVTVTGRHAHVALRSPGCTWELLACFPARSLRRKVLVVAGAELRGRRAPPATLATRSNLCCWWSRRHEPGRCAQARGFSSRVALSFWSRCSVADEQEMSTRLHRRGQRGSWHAACGASPGQPLLLGLVLEL